jgi:exonuclease III
VVRLLVWNCCMGLGKERQLLYELRPDIAVVSECSCDSMRACEADGFQTCWWGTNKNKGLGVVARKPWTLGPGRSPSQKWIAPVRVRGPEDFLLIAVWASAVGTLREMNYVGQTYEALIRHPKWFSGGCPVVMGGDLNSNSSLDPGRKIRQHRRVVELLARRGIVSAYHSYFGEEHGAETRPTYYFWHREPRPFHLDYIFLPRSWMKRVTDLGVGSFATWRRASDHMPLWVDLADVNSRVD